ncbi:MAG: hypothetical protein LUJ09_01280 [Firmicutes bacterium]|nr:hypothetical protein [Bacillota bacterium]
MSFLDTVMEKWDAIYSTWQPRLAAVGRWFCRVWDALAAAVRYVGKMRKVFLAVPVGVAAVALALYNMRNLPAVVGLDIQTNGEFTYQIAREIAVLGPMAFTAVCLLLMFVSRRTLTPWLVSVFSLAIPLLILVTNTFPA